MGRQPKEKISAFESKRRDLKIEYGTCEHHEPKPFRPLPCVNESGFYDKDVDALSITQYGKPMLAGFIMKEGLYALTLLSDKELENKVTFKDLYKIFGSYETVISVVKIWMDLGLIEKQDIIEADSKSRGRSKEFQDQIVKIKPTGKNFLGSVYNPFISFKNVKEDIDSIIQPIKKCILEGEGLKGYALVKQEKDKEFDSFMKELDDLLV